MLPRILVVTAIAVLILFAGYSVLRYGNSRDAGLPAQFSSTQEAGLVDRGPASSRVALVIGIDHYENLGANNQLERAKSDARAVAAKLKSLGYDTILDTDATREKIYLDLDRAVHKIKPGGAAFFYFAGHGIATKAANFLDGANYLVPSDAASPDQHTQSAFEASSVPLISIIQQFRRSGARISVIVLDACRDSPFQARSATRASRRGRQSERGGNDFYILYSASAGQTALDRLPGVDGDPNSVFTRVLLKQLSDQARLQDLTRSVESGVSALTSGRQTPVAYSDTDDRLTVTGDVTQEDRPFATVAPPGSRLVVDKTPILREVQESVDKARTAEADAREWARSAELANAKAATLAKQAEEAQARSEKHLAGYGSKVLDDGTNYEGQLADGQPDGVGVGIKEGVSIYQGEWSQAKKNGFGRYESLKNHFSYAGEWHDDKEDGAGIYKTATNEVYEGEFHHQIPDGFGVLTGAPTDPFREEVGQFNDSDRGASYSVVYERGDVVVYGPTKHGKLEGPAAKLDRAGHVLQQGYYEDDVLKTGM